MKMVQHGWTTLLLKNTFVFILLFFSCEIENYPYFIKPNNIDELNNIDFLIIRYSWTAANGTDFDTRTAIIDPARNIDVGWARQSEDSPFLTWGGDNRAVGYEAALIEVKKLEENHPNLEKFDIRMRGFWYSAVYDGNYTIEFSGYNGGEMVKDISGYNWENQGGTLERNMTVNRNTMTTGGDIDGDDAGTARYYVASKILEILDP